MRKNKKQTNKKNKRILDQIASPFDCSGVFQLKPFVINLMSLKEHLVLKFPNPIQEDLKKAADNGKKSGFGKGTQNVVDESYRMAFEYLPDQIGLPSPLMEKIFNETTEAIKHSLGFDCTVRAELIKLNIYPVGGLFKKHVDSPKLEAFGSLVVFLPCYFLGGDLIVQKKEESHTFSFGGDKQSTNVQWVAFYNDCVHEITEVTQGWRLTLSFNLFFETLLQTQIFPKQEIINSLLQNLQQGKVYGYYCDHYYGNMALENARKKAKNMRFFKGNDYNVYVAAKALGAKKILLKVLFKEYLRKNDFEKYQPESQLSEQQKSIQKPDKKDKSIKKASNNLVRQDQSDDDQNPFDQQAENIILVGNPQSIQKITNWVDYESEDPEILMFLKQLKTKRWDSENYEKVVWLNQEVESSNYTYAIRGYYGNDYSIEEKYCQLVILIYM